MVRVLLIYILILLLYVSAQAEASAVENVPIKTVAISDLEAHGITESEAATLTDVLRNKLIETGKYQVMERSQMKAILEEQAFQQSGTCTDQECIVEMGQILGIEQIVAGSIGRVGKTYSINVRMVSVQTGEIINSVSHNYTGPVENLLITEIDVVANKLSGIETVFEPRVDKKKPRNKKNIRRNFIIGGVALAVIGGGVGAFLLLKEDKEEPATLEVTW